MTDRPRRDAHFPIAANQPRAARPVRHVSGGLCSFRRGRSVPAAGNIEVPACRP